MLHCLGLPLFADLADDLRGEHLFLHDLQTREEQNEKKSHIFLIFTHDSREQHGLSVSLN